MTDSEMTDDAAGTSRRTLLKGAVGAGVGLAAWTAPKIGTIPAYALTNSTGVFDGVCYYFHWNTNGTNWRRGGGGAPGNATGRADDVQSNGSGDDRTFTWFDVFPGGEDLVVRAAGNPEGETATITLVTPPAGCTFESSSMTLYSNRPNMNGSYSDLNDCVANRDPTEGTVTLGGTSGMVMGVSAVADPQHFVIFNVTCD